MLSRHIKSVLGRRLFARFVLAALIPIAVLAAVNYNAVEQLLVDHAHEQLHQDSRDAGMGFISQLSWRAELLKELAARDGRVPATAGGFASMGLISEAEQRALDPELLRSMDRFGVGLVLSGPGAPFMLTRYATTQRVLRARIDREELWQTDTISEPYCVLDAVRRPLFCTQGLDPSPYPQTSGKARAVSTLFVGGEPFYAMSWRARLHGLFGNEGFEVLVTAPQSLLKIALTRFTHSFLASMVLAFVVAAALAISQIQRQVRPSDRLTKGARRLATGNFDAVRIRGDDEFAEVATAFNRMSARLCRKFNMLRLLADLDRMILGTLENPRLVDPILSVLTSAVECESAGIIVIDAQGEATFIQAADAETPRMPPRKLSAVNRALVDENLVEDVHAFDFDFVASLTDMAPNPLRHALMFPVTSVERLECALVLSIPASDEHPEEIIQAGRSLADRLKLAVSSAEREEALYRQSHYDALTQLPNRIMLRDRVEQAFIRADREKRQVALLSINLDRFKRLNDTFGQGAGDELLVEAARRLTNGLRPNDTAARLSADEFVILMTDLQADEVSSMLHLTARALSAMLQTPMQVAGKTVEISASIGIAIYPDNARRYDDLLAMADAAMRLVKVGKSGGFRFYSESMQQTMSIRFELEQELRETVRNNELLLHFQPKVAVATGRIVGAEALIRWHSPKRGMVSPAEFVPVIDEIGLTSWLSDFVLDRVCRQLVEWDQAGLPPIAVSINIAPSELSDVSFFDRVTAALNAFGLSPGRLELEILESVEITGENAVRSTLQKLRNHGLTIALDDFGTGYSSLVYLTDVPADVLKLDRAFLKNLTTDTRQQIIVERVIALAQSLGFSIVAEGVEASDQYRLLAEMGCDLIQGYLFSKPLPADTFAQRLMGELATPDNRSAA